MKPAYIFFYSILLVVGISLNVSANTSFPNKFEHLTIEDGLSHNTITCVIQDKLGLLWFGSVKGLNRYDGYSFRVFTFNPNDSGSIPSNYIRCLLEDSNGNIWVGTDNGLSRFNYQTGTFTVFRNQLDDSTSLSNNYIKSLLEDHNGDIWVGTGGGGLNKIDKEQKLDTNIEFMRIGFVMEFEGFNEDIETIYEDELNRLWIGTQTNLILIVSNENSKDVSSKCFSLLNIPNKTIVNISSGRNNGLLISTFEGGVFEFNLSPNSRDSIEVTPLASNISNHSVNASYIDSDDNLWVSTRGNGICYFADGFNETNSKFKQLKHNVRVEKSLAGNHVNGVFEDRSGVIWILIEGHGINKYEPKIQPFFTVGEKNNGAVPINNIASLVEDENGDLIIGTRGYGLYKYQFENISEKGSFEGKLLQLNWTESKIIRSILIDNDGNYWLAVENKGIQVFNKEGKQIREFGHDKNNPNSLSHNYVFEIFQDSKGLVWIGSWGGSWGGGLDMYNPKTGKFTSFSHDPKNQNSLSENVVLSITEDHFGHIWAGTKRAGLNRLAKNQNGEYTIERFMFNPKNSASLNDNHVTDIYFGSDSSLWVSTESGINRFNFSEQKFIRDNSINNIDKSQIAKIVQDDKGLLWFGTLKGISRFDPLSGKRIAFDSNDGLLLFGYPEGLKLTKRNGVMFAGQGGLVLFRPSEILQNSFIPPVVISDIQISNIDKTKSENKKLHYSIPSKNKIILPYDENNFSLQFAALSFIKQNKNKYAFRLDGFDEKGQWNYPKTGQRFMNYSNLREGEYTFKVKASNNDGVWNEAGKSLKIEVLPPYYRTSLAYVFYFLIIASLVYLFLRLILKREEEKNRLSLERMERRKVEELNQLKLRFFTNVSHEFRTPLTLILAPIDRLLKPSSEFSDAKRNEIYQGIHKNANRLLRLVNELMDFRKIDSGKMTLEAQHDDLVEFLQNIYSCFKDVAEEDNISFQFQSSQKEIPMFFDPEKLEKVIFNLLSNSFKNTSNGGEIILSVSNHQTDVLNNALIKVCDNGNGIAKQDLPKIFERFYHADKSNPNMSHQKGTGIGLALAKDLIELHKGDIFVNSEVNKYTCFSIKLPLGRAHLSSEEIQTSSQPFLSDFSERKKDVENDKPKETPESEEIHSEKPCLLIVDDNCEIRTFLRNEFKNDYNISEAEDGIKGLEKAYQVNPDLIISDVMMPEMDGFEFCKVLKTKLKTSHIPVVLLTAKSTEESLIEGLEIGADAYISKPFKMNVLEVRVRKLLEIRQKLRQLYANTLEPDPRTLVTNNIDEEFLTKAIQLVEDNLDDSELNLDMFCEKMGLGKTRLNGKLKALTGKSTGEFIRSIRLKHAAHLLKEGNLNVSEVCYSVGFGTMWYFAKCFKNEFHIAPSDYRKGDLFKSELDENKN